MRSVRLLLGPALALLLASGCLSSLAPPPRATDAPQPRRGSTVKLGRVVRGDINGVLSFTANLQSGAPVVVSPRVAGTLARIIPQVGSRVNEGDPVAELDKGALEAEQQRAQAALNAAEARKAQLQAAARPEEVAMAQALVNASQARLNEVQSGAAKPPAEALAELSAARQHLAGLEGVNGDAVGKAQAALDSAQAQLDVLAKDSTPARDKVEQVRVAVQAARQQLAAARQPANPDELSKARDAVAAAEHQMIQSSLAGSPASLQEAQAFFEAANQRLKLVSAPASDAELAAAQAEIDQAGATLELSRQALRNATMTAPTGGVVAERFVSEGTLVGPGVAVLQIVPPDLAIEFRVPEAQVGNVAAGQEISVAVAAFPQETFSGVISATAPAVDPRDRTVLARAAVADPQGKLKAGMFSQVALNIGSREGALLLPLDAVVEQAGLSYAWQVVDGRARRSTLKLGVRDAQRVEVTDGLEDGAEVVVGPVAGLNDGDYVLAQ